MRGRQGNTYQNTYPPAQPKWQEGLCQARDPGAIAVLTPKRILLLMNVPWQLTTLQVQGPRVALDHVMLIPIS